MGPHLGGGVDAKVFTLKQTGQECFVPVPWQRFWNAGDVDRLDHPKKVKKSPIWLPEQSI